MKIEEERKAFEAWAIEAGIDDLSGEYEGPGRIGWLYWDDLADSAWEGWQARAFSAPAVPAGELPPLPEPAYKDILRAGFVMQDAWTAEQMHEYARAGMAEQTPEHRAGAALFGHAKILGWSDDGEGAYEYVQRMAYAAGVNSVAAQQAVEPMATVRRVCESYRGTKLGKAAEIIGDRITESLQRNFATPVQAATDADARDAALRAITDFCPPEWRIADIDDVEELQNIARAAIAAANQGEGK